MEEREKEKTLVVKWNGAIYDVMYSSSETVGDVKRRLYATTRVPPERQKLLGVQRDGRLASDDAPMHAVVLKGTVLLMGTPDDGMLVDMDLPPDQDVQDDDDFIRAESVSVATRYLFFVV